MKGKLTLLFALLPLFTFTKAQWDESSDFSFRQSVTPALDIRINNSQRLKYHEFSVYFNNVNFMFRQDFSNTSKYAVALNPALWGLQYGLTKLFLNPKSDLADFILTFPYFIGDVLPNMKFDIYWAHFGWNTDYIIYNKKLMYVISFNLGLKYEIKRTALSVTYGTEYPDRDFMPPWEKNDGKFNVEITFDFDNTALTTFIFTRGLRTE